MAKLVKSPIPDNIFEKAITGAKELLGVFDKIVEELKRVGTVAKTTLGDLNFSKAEDVTKLTEEIKKLEAQVKDLEEVKKSQVKTSQDLNKMRENEAEVTKQLASLTDEEVKAKLRFQAANKKQRDELKLLLALEDKELGTLGKLNAANKKLRLEREKLNAEIPEQRARFDQLNAEIDENNEKITELSDKQKQAKLNVGNYSDSIQEALGSSEAFSSATSGLSEAQGLLAAILKVSTLALSKNKAQTKDSARATTRLGRTTRRVSNAIKASVVGLVIAAGAALGSFITGTQEGQIQFQKLVQGTLSGVNVLLGRFKDIGSGISSFIGGSIAVLSGNFSKARKSAEEAAKAFSNAFAEGLTKDIAAAAAAASELVKTQFLAANAGRAVAAEIERRLQLEEELRAVFDDDTRGFIERTQAAERLTTIFQTGNSALDQQAKLLKDQLDIARERLLISIKERAGGRVDTDALKAQINASTELSEIVVTNKKLLSENNALIIDTQVLDELIAAEQAFIQKETELNGQRLADRQLIAKLLFDEVEQELDFLIDGNEQIKTSNEELIASEKVTFAERKRLLAETIKLIADSNEAVLNEIARTVVGLEGAEIGKAFEDALDVSDLNTRLKQLGLAEIPINRLLELFREIKTQQRDFKGTGEALDEALLGGREASDRIKILKQSNTELTSFAKQIIALSKVSPTTLTGARLTAFNAELEALNESIADAQTARSKDLLSLEIEQLEARFAVSKEGSALFLQLEEELLQKRLDFISIEQAEALKAIDKEDKARQEAADKEEKRLTDLSKKQEEAAKNRAAALTFLDNALTAAAESRQEDLDKQISDAQRRQEEIQSAIEAGSEGARESLTQARREEEEATQAREKSIERQKQLEATLTMLKLISSYAGSGVTNPVGKATRDIISASAFADAFFYEGTERVDQDKQIKKVHSGRDGYRAGLSGDERVMTGKQNSKVGNLSNDILANVGYLYRTGKLVHADRSGGESLSLEELKGINKTLKGLPGKIPVANLDKEMVTGIVTAVLKRGNNRTRTRETWASKA